MLAIPFTQNGKFNPGRPAELQRVGMQKGMFSSPAAALESTSKRIALLTGKNSPSADEASEVAALQEFATALDAITPASFSKYQRLLTHLRDLATGWKPDNADDRLVIFSERIETLRWLHSQFMQDIKLKPNQLVVMDGSMTDTEQQEIVERFGRHDDSLRVLLCSDVASEGLNLHYFCHRLVHFDLPWSLMVFQQRNGRVDRYGQKHRPEITYLFTETQVEKIKGDLRILEILTIKDEQANKNLGDPASFLNVFDPEKEADKVSGFMADGVSPESVEQKLDPAVTEDEDNEGDWLLQLFGGGEPATDEKQTSLDQINAPTSLFAGDYQFAKSAFQVLSKEKEFAQWAPDDGDQLITLTAPKDLQDRLRQLPREVIDANPVSYTHLTLPTSDLV